jgi:hypothetical protein
MQMLLMMPMTMSEEAEDAMETKADPSESSRQRPMREKNN